MKLAVFAMMLLGGGAAAAATEASYFDHWAVAVLPQAVLLHGYTTPRFQIFCGADGLGISALPVSTSETNISLKCNSGWHSELTGTVIGDVLVLSRENSQEVPFVVRRLIEEASKSENSCSWEIGFRQRLNLERSDFANAAKAFIAACSARNQLR